MPEKLWYAEGLRFTCTTCGTCCKGPLPGYVYVGPKEIQRLAKHLELTVDEFGARYLRRVDGKLSLTEKPRTRDCVFWADEGGCEVYRARPTQCRQFPFWPESLADPNNWAEESDSCPGMDKGRLYEVEEIHRIRDGGRATRSGRRKTRKLPAAGS